MAQEKDRRFTRKITRGISSGWYIDVADMRTGKRRQDEIIRDYEGRSNVGDIPSKKPGPVADVDPFQDEWLAELERRRKEPPLIPGPSIPSEQLPWLPYWKQHEELKNYNLVRSFTPIQDDKLLGAINSVKNKSDYVGIMRISRLQKAGKINIDKTINPVSFEEQRKIESFMKNTGKDLKDLVKLLEEENNFTENIEARRQYFTAYTDYLVKKQNKE